MGVLLNWAAATVMGGVLGAGAAGACPSHDSDGVAIWPAELRHQLRHEIGLAVAMPRAWGSANRCLVRLSYDEYKAAFGADALYHCDGEGPPRAEPELVLTRTRELRETHLARCAKDRESTHEREIRWEREWADTKARRLAHRDPG